MANKYKKANHKELLFLNPKELIIFFKRKKFITVSQKPIIYSREPEEPKAISKGISKTAGKGPRGQ